MRSRSAAVATVETRRRVSANGILRLELPTMRGLDVDVFVRPHDSTIPADSMAVMQAQERTGFATEVLGDPAEDVWNAV